MVCSLFNIIAVIVCIPFYTLLERKVLSYVQLRKGPNKVSLGGVLQPLRDGVKLIRKEGRNPITVSSWVF